MSIHKSLFIGGELEQQRSVLSRRERLDSLIKEGRWEPDGTSVFGIPKVRTKFKVLSRKQKKVAEAAIGGAGEGEAGSEGAAEAAGSEGGKS